MNVNVNTLAEFDIQTDEDILPLLFAINKAFPATIKDVDGTSEIFFENKNLVQFLKDWQTMKDLLQSGSQTIIKKIVGHSSAMTLTKKVYTLFDVKELVNVINKI